ncbi:MAG: chromosomal replication initiator protein DnaA [Bacteroidetes bacterium]|nr:chromosomal replication initiator protein DnaA [Bacteroidota bacterium]
MHRQRKTVWNNCLQMIKENINEQNFKTWFEPIVPVKLDNNVLTIQVPSLFFYEWIEEHYVHILKKAIHQELGQEGRLEYSVVVDKGDDTHKPYTINLPAGDTIQNYSNVKVKQKAGTNPFMYKNINKSKFDSNLNPYKNFESFLEGDCNRLARAAGERVSEKPGTTSFNPLMIHSAPGLGKTHLVQAIGNQIKQNDAEKLVLYLPSVSFFNQYITSVKNNNTQDFINFYLQVDVLILDDIHNLSGKEGTQEIFFHIFNDLHNARKQIILTSDTNPKDLVGIKERLISRFKWGLIADLQQPDFETKFAIIKRKIQDDGINFPDNVIEYLAHSVDTSIRDLEGAIISLIAQSSLNNKEIDLEITKRILQNIVTDIVKDVSIDFIQKSVARYSNIDVDDLSAKTRKKEIVAARQMAMYFAKEYTNLSLKSIGEHFGGRDHSTVLHAIQSVDDMLTTDRHFKVAFKELQKKLQLKSV